ncbi:MAG: monovalent cation/H+ antiporter complex subunit F [Verrucomicrobia bacterium]|nr:monovalent cation/H+ antiporter complex subunit F [Verrucomicrobiota bacterium]
MTLLHPFLVGTGLFMFVLMLPLMYRVVLGPTALDRIMAINMVGTKTAVLLVIIGQIFDRAGMFVDFALAYALLNFMGSLAAARYFRRTRQVKPALNPDSQPEAGGQAA